ncbi:tRNA(His) guanylyltransferase Thg1 family protein [Streptomyces sp. CHB9.2]|uniref:tRNA(His) guanylyltransferase Thg1 family protein n=1 Tax=Streptomyces sp. CHB9.2 TaxID=2841670 RepID=UPI0020957F5C|nr:tRNA(His) guanylyltransferase Thg1 family protein [Streptomyces sp. CHB9.2]MCO6704710.1 tRNA(His) guanylyltransferase Thg1 family protein [Streptomyces sp. CHB9.2]
MNDALGDRMKMYEMAEAGRKFMPLLPIVARIDGRKFSSFTSGLRRPYDVDLQACMIATCDHLVRHTGAVMGYTQSDEITLAWYSDSLKKQLWFNGRISKMTCHLAAQATLFFYREVCKRLPPKYAEKLPTFDARVWQVPNFEEAANVFLWREWDATKNAITMAAHEFYSTKELHGKNGRERIELLFQKGVRFSDYPASFRRGQFIQRRVLNTPFTAEELAELPPKHKAHTDPSLVVSRSRIVHVDMPIFGTVLNRADVIFNGALPQTEGPEALVMSEVRMNDM